MNERLLKAVLLLNTYFFRRFVDNLARVQSQRKHLTLSPNTIKPERSTGEVIQHSKILEYINTYCPTLYITTTINLGTTVWLPLAPRLVNIKSNLATSAAVWLPLAPRLVNIKSNLATSAAVWLPLAPRLVNIKSNLATSVAVSLPANVTSTTIRAPPAGC
ncbi:hypothetical protein RRG08_037454 [Elysia crispata]|uniref:Uncharacterized protein n=1 Tax=Elysia crispata TaxID=231223 RepID=A0AAE0Y459_9GAST|nr:hypothetical protein RRG08_037454 [Elysia crispata]